MSQWEANEIACETQRRMRLRGAMKIVLPTAAALGAGAAIAVGAIPGSDGTITGCYAGPNGLTISGFAGSGGTATVVEPPGALRVIDPSQKGLDVSSDVYECRPKEETQITWNQKGPAGPQGPAGPAGAPGAPGAPGESGLPGETTFGFDNSSGNMFLKLDGIKGESTDSKHKGDIQIESFQWGVGRGISAATGGAGAGKTTIESFQITKVLDKSSPLLLSAATAGKHFKEADLLFAHKASGKQMDFLEIKMENVLISSVQDGSSAKGKPQESISFNFQKVEEIYLNGNGKPQATVKIDLTANKAL